MCVMIAVFTLYITWFETHDIISVSYFTANHGSEKRELQPEASYILSRGANAAEV